jgi:hypothetical protein
LQRTLTRKQAANLIRQSPVFTIVSGSTETRRELLSVTGLRHEGADTYADFDYFWSGDMPSALLGVTLAATARFRLYDDGWRLDEPYLKESLQTLQVRPTPTAPAKGR